MSKIHKNISLAISNGCEVQKEKDISDDKNDDSHEPVSCKKQTNRKDIARRRWGILAKALKSPISSQPSSPTDEISMRRFSTFMLLTTEPLQDDDTNTDNTNQYIEINSYYDMIPSNNTTTFISVSERKCNNKRIMHQYKKRIWYRYSGHINGENYFIDIGHMSRSFTAADLMGFNNTGNVCVWPSEEALAYYILNHLDLFHGKTVLELGAGMSALAGLMVAKYGGAKFVHLTDGNDLAVENIKSSLERNHFDCCVSSSVLQWSSSEEDLSSTFDIILSADCLFFDEVRNDLIETIWRGLDASGTALVMAPKRGDTLDIFLAHASLRGFACRKLLVYDPNVWNRHLECLDNPDYDEDIHYPILLILTKSSLIA